MEKLRTADLGCQVSALLEIKKNRCCGIQCTPIRDQVDKFDYLGSVVLTMLLALFVMNSVVAIESTSTPVVQHDFMLRNHQKNAG